MSELLTDNAKVSAQFIVVKRGRCLLGYSTAIDLEVLHVGAAPTPVAENCNIVVILLSCARDCLYQLYTRYWRALMGVLCFLNLICVEVFTKLNWIPIQEMLLPLSRMTGFSGTSG